MQLIINRLEFNEFNTIGSLKVRNSDKSEIIFECKTLELAWINNKKSISSIPKGKYELIKHYSDYLKRNVLWIKNVPDREWIYIHDGQRANSNDISKSDTTGCILVGEYIDDKNGDGIVEIHNSESTFATIFSFFIESEGILHLE